MSGSVSVSSMTESDLDRRFSQASDLQRALGSLNRVPSADRQVFQHDRLMSSIDDICKKSSSKAPFNAQQIEVLKEISFRIYYILDPLNKPQKLSFFAEFWQEFSEKSPIEKVKMSAGALVFIIAFANGIYNLVLDPAYRWVIESRQSEKNKSVAGQEHAARSSSPVPPGPPLPLMLKQLSNN